MLKDGSESNISTYISQSRPPRDRTAICVAGFCTHLMGLSYMGVGCVCLFLSNSPQFCPTTYLVKNKSYKYFSLLWALLHFCKCQWLKSIRVEVIFPIKGSWPTLKLFRIKEKKKRKVLLDIGESSSLRNSQNGHYTDEQRQS